MTPSGLIGPRPWCLRSSRGGSGADRSCSCSPCAERSSSTELARLPDLRLGGCRTRHARELLAAVIGAPLDERVRARILAEARGNPLALLELPRELSPASLAGGFGLPGELPLQSRIEASFRRRVQQLPADTQRLLLLAAAEPTGRAGPAVAIGGGARDRRPKRPRPPSGRACSSSGRASPSATRSCGPRSIRRRRPMIGVPRIGRWRPPPMLRSTPIAERGTSLRPRSAPDEDVADELERSAGGRRRVADWRLPPRSSAGCRD